MVSISKDCFGGSIVATTGFGDSFFSFCRDKLCFFSAVLRKTATVVLNAVLSLQISGVNGEWSQTGQTPGRLSRPGELKLV